MELMATVSSNGKVPSIASFSSETFVDIMEQYKSGDRKGDKFTPEGGKETDMGAIANALSDDDNKKIIAFLSAQKLPPCKSTY